MFRLAELKKPLHRAKPVDSSSVSPYLLIICLRVFATRVLVPEEARRVSQISWSRNHRWLGAAGLKLGTYSGPLYEQEALSILSISPASPPPAEILDLKAQEEEGYQDIDKLCSQPPLAGADSLS